MAKASDKGLFRWDHGDWRRAATESGRRAKLVLHIEEVERFAAESQSRGDRLTLHQNILPGLVDELAKLDRAAAMRYAANRHGVGGVRRFRRGGNA